MPQFDARASSFDAYLPRRRCRAVPRRAMRQRAAPMKDVYKDAAP